MKKNRQKGFTLVELIIVIAVVAILVAVLVPTLTSVIDKANESSDKQLAASITSALVAADENDMATAQNLRAFLKQNGIDKIQTKKKDNVIVFDYNAKKAEVLKLKGNAITAATGTMVLRAAPEGDEYNKAPVAPEEIIAGKLLLSTKGNALAEAVYALRQGEVTQALIEKFINLDKTAAKSLTLALQKLVGQSLFIGAGGQSKAFQMTGSTAGYTLKLLPKGDAYGELKYALFSEDCDEISATTFRYAEGINRVIVPASVSKIAADAFAPLYTQDENTKLVVAFSGSGDYGAVKEAIGAAGGIVAQPAQTIAAIRNDSDVFFSGITEYRDIDSFAALKANLDAPAGTALRIGGFDVVIDEDVTIPAGVTLLLPCMDGDEGYSSATGYNPDGTQKTTGAPKGEHIREYSRLTVAAGATLALQGHMLVNAVTGQPAAGHYDMDVNGGYATVVLEGTITVKKDGLLDCCGYIGGNGAVEAEDGGEVRDLYVVKHWRGGSQAFNIYPDVYPMNEYDMHNITSRILLSERATLTGTVKMFASGSYYYTRFPQVDKSNGLLRLAAGATLERTYVDGREVYTAEGGAVISSSTLKIVGMDLSTKDFVYPVDGDITLNLKGGKYAFAAGVKGYKFMPGAVVTVDATSSLTVPAGITVVFYDRFDDVKNTSTTQYPADRGAAELRLAGGAAFTAAGSFAGNIVSSGTAAIKLKSAAAVTTFEANGYLGGIKPLEFSNKLIRQGYSAVKKEAGDGYFVIEWQTDAEAINRFNALPIMSKTIETITAADKPAVNAALEDYKYLSDTAKAAVAENYALLQALYQKVTVKATIGERAFMTLQLAIDAAVSGDTISMAEDTNEAITVPAGLTVTIDLGGFKLVKNDVLVNNAGALTLKNGTCDNTGALSKEIIQNTGTLTLEKLILNCGQGIANGTSKVKSAVIEKILDCRLTSLKKYSLINYGTVNLIAGGKLNGNTAGESYASNGCISNYGVIDACENVVFEANGRCIYNRSKGEIKSMIACRVSGLGKSGAALYNSASVGVIGDCTIVSESYYAVYNGSGSTIESLDAVIEGNYAALIQNYNTINIAGGYFKNEKADGAVIAQKVDYSHDDDFSLAETHFKTGFALSTTPLQEGEFAGYYTLTAGFEISFNLTEFDDATAAFTPSYLMTVRNYPAGTRVEAAPFTPRKLNTANYSFTFKGWADENGRLVDLAAVTGDTALYEAYEKTELSEFVQLTQNGTVTTYKRLQAALDALTGDTATVKLLGNITEEEAVVPQKVDLVLDLNGYVFGAFATPLRVYGSLTIKDGSAAQTGKLASETSSIMYVGDSETGSTVNFEGGNFAGKWGVSIYENSTVNVRGGNFSTVYALFDFSANAVLNIYGGRFNGYIDMFDATAALNIYGGDFFCDNDNTIYVSDGKLFIENGTFYSYEYAVKAYTDVTIIGGRYKAQDGRDYCFNDDFFFEKNYKLSETADSDGYYAVVPLSRS